MHASIAPFINHNYYLPRKSSHCIPGTFGFQSQRDITASCILHELIIAYPNIMTYNKYKDDSLLTIYL